MARAIWSGSVSFGLVNVPVKLFSATSEKTVKFNQISAKTGARIRQVRVDPTTGDEVPYEEILKGFEISSDRYITLEPDELEAIAPKSNRTIELNEFVSVEEIDPIFYDKTYYLGPAEGGEKAYHLLVAAMGQAEVVGVGKVVLRSKEKLVILRAKDKRLALTTLMFADEVNDPYRVVELEPDGELNEREVAMAVQLIGSLTAEWDPTAYRDAYREQVLELIERKAAGEAIEAPTKQDEPAATPNLMAALEASLAAAQGEDKPKRKGKQSATKEKAAA